MGYVRNLLSNTPYLDNNYCRHSSALVSQSQKIYSEAPAGVAGGWPTPKCK